MTGTTNCVPETDNRPGEEVCMCHPNKVSLSPFIYRVSDSAGIALNWPLHNVLYGPSIYIRTSDNGYSE